MRLMAIDLGEKTGWARASGGARPSSGVEQMPQTGDDLGATCVALENFLRFHFKEMPRPDAVIYARSLAFGQPGQSAQMKKLGMAMVLEGACYRLDIPLHKAWEITMRKSFLGGEKVPRRSVDAKAAIMAECERRDWHVTDHNAADALCCLEYLRSEIFKESCAA